MKRRVFNHGKSPKATQKGWDSLSPNRSTGDRQDTDLLSTTREPWSNLLGFDISNRLAAEILTGFSSLVDFLQHCVDNREPTADAVAVPLENVHETFLRQNGERDDVKD